MISTRTYRDSGVQFEVDGISFTIVTNETGAAAIDRFKTICEANDTDLSRVILAYESKVHWNRTHPKEARDWPEFRQRERLVNRLLKEAGIKST